MKTLKATAKRFKITGKGKLRRLKGRRSHLRRKKWKQVRRGFDKDYPVDKVNRKRVRRLLVRRKRFFISNSEKRRIALRKAKQRGRNRQRWRERRGRRF
jgi:large subunit ribosomal protein L35